MTACETCWNKAYVQSRTLGGSQVERYQQLMQGRFDTHPHTTPTTTTAPECAERKS